MTDMDDIKKWLELQPSRVKSNVDIIDNTEGQGPPPFSTSPMTRILEDSFL